MRNRASLRFVTHAKRIAGAQHSIEKNAMTSGYPNGNDW